MKNNTKKSAFTIIEVVLVLGIAGLIFLAVFIAVPALQRSQRDTKRMEDMARVVAAVSSYVGNNSGNSPWSHACPDGTPNEEFACVNSENYYFVRDYLDPELTMGSDPLTSYRKFPSCGDGFRDPDGECYGMLATGGSFGTDYPYADGWLEQLQSLGPSGFGTMEELKQDHVMYVLPEAQCADEGQTAYIPGYENVAIMMVTETGKIICKDNS